MSLEIIVTRSSRRAAISSVAPHAGKATDDHPHLGVLRWALTADGLLIWATDHNTSAAAHVDVVEYLGDELQEWSTTVGVAKKILAVFKASSTRSDDGDVMLQVAGEQLHLTETGGLIPGEHLKVPRLTIPEHDEYPDVPRILHVALTAPATRHGHAFIDWAHLVVFASSLRAWGSKGHLTIVDGERPAVVVRAGKYFVGVVAREDGTGDDTRTREDRTDHARQNGTWADNLAPLRRPVKVRLTPFQSDNLAEQALAVIADNPAGTHFRVTAVPTEGASS